MPFVDVAQSPLAPGRSPVRIAYHDVPGAGVRPPIVVLHGGWGYDMYPFDAQIDALRARHRVVIPHRAGYGASTPIDTLPADFHQRAADETRVVLDALGLERPILWGHSDGAIIALRLGLANPDGVSAVIAEATHYFRQKPRSRAFFDAVIANPESTPMMRLHAQAWRRIDDEAAPGEDFYDRRLSQLRAPALIVHGARDPRTEPGEIEALRAACPNVRLFEAGGHSPHSEAATAVGVTRAAVEFVDDRA